jgi:hypothetical protein
MAERCRWLPGRKPAAGTLRPSRVWRAMLGRSRAQNPCPHVLACSVSTSHPVCLQHTICQPGLQYTLHQVPATLKY